MKYFSRILAVIVLVGIGISHVQAHGHKHKHRMFHREAEGGLRKCCLMQKHFVELKHRIKALEDEELRDILKTMWVKMYFMKCHMLEQEGKLCDNCQAFVEKVKQWKHKKMRSTCSVCPESGKGGISCPCPRCCEKPRRGGGWWQRERSGCEGGTCEVSYEK